MAPLVSVVALPMIATIRKCCALTVLGAAVFAGGCAKSLPPIVPVEGTITVNNQPLPFVYVTFSPQLSDWGPEANSYGETDDKGHFTLICTYNQSAGAVVGKHLVGLGEKLPDEARNQDVASAKRVAARLAGLPNRPIPPGHGRGGAIEVEVTKGKATYDINLIRSAK